jgi:hypothetical protein
LLPERPAFFITAGKRGGGKTTTIKMAIMAVMGVLAAAQAWSTSEEERRKVLLAQLNCGVGYILWDNIEKGSQISCPHIERALTTEIYMDRKLGVSETIATAASEIQIFTGNNVSPRGDLASRSLNVRLAVERPDPENRDFKHPNVLDWTEAHRADILRALYTILLGNPQLRTPPDAPSHTRFKMWWRLVGSAVEHAVELYGGSLDFRELFIAQEETDDQDTVSLVEFLEAVSKHWPDGFTAAEVAEVINENMDFTFRPTLVDFLYPDWAPNSVSAQSVSSQLGKHLDEPVATSRGVLKLTTDRSATGRRDRGKQRGSLLYRVTVRGER